MIRDWRWLLCHAGGGRVRLGRCRQHRGWHARPWGRLGNLHHECERALPVAALWYIVLRANEAELAKSRQIIGRIERRPNRL